METSQTPVSNDSPKFVGLLFNPSLPLEEGHRANTFTDDRFRDAAFGDSLPDVDAKLLAWFAHEVAWDPLTNALHDSYIRIRDVRPLILLARVRAASGDTALADALTRLEEVR